MKRIKAFLIKLNNMSPAAKASFWFVVSNVVLKGISFITTPIFTRLLNVADYGISNVFITWEGIISIFATLSLSGGVYNVAMTKFEDDVDTLTSSLIGLTAVASIFVYLCCIGINLIFPNVFELTTGYLIFMWVQTFFNATTTFWLMRKRFTYDYKKVIAYTFSNAILSPVVAIIAVKLAVENKAYARVIGSGLWGIIVGAVIMIMLLYKGKKLYHKQYWKYALGFNLPLLPHYLAGVISSSSNRIILNYFYGPVSVGLYSIGGSISGVMGIVTGSINSSLIPYTLQSIKNGTYKKLRNAILGCSLLISVMCGCILLFAREAILILATPEYLNAIWSVAPLVVSEAVFFVTGLLGNIVFYYEKSKYMSMATIITAILNIILNVIGIKCWGPYAVGYTTLLISLARFFMYYIIVKKFEKHINEIFNLKLLLLVFLALFILMLFSLLFINNLFAKIIFVSIIFVLLIVFRKQLFSILNILKG